MSKDLMALLMMVLFVNPAAVELFVWMGDLGCCHPISSSVFCIGTIFLDVRYSAASSDPSADSITGLMIFAIVKIAPFSGSVATSLVKKMCAPALLLALVSFSKPVSACAYSTMPISLKIIP